MSTQAQVFSGRVSSVVYQNDDFRILKFIEDGGSAMPFTVKGNFPAQNVVVGSWVAFEGKWISHPQYGRQVSVTRSPVSIGKWTDKRVLSALEANGVGPQLRFKLKCLAGNRNCDLASLLDSGDLSDLTGESDVTKQYVISRWRNLRAHLDAARFLSDAGVPAHVIGKVWKELGDELEEKITEDPWILVRVAGIRFTEADEVARRLGVPLSNKGRVNGAVLTVVQNVGNEGHVFARTGQIVSMVNKLMPGSPPSSSEIAQSIKDLFAQDQLAVTKAFGSVAVYEPWVEEMERTCAEMLARRMEVASQMGLDPAFAEQELLKWAQGRKVTFTETQMKAAVKALTEGVSVLTGLPGTGKTTTLRSVVSVLRDSSTTHLLVAPTGIAAKRLASVTGADAATVHRGFGAAGGNEDEEREATYVGIVGEASQKKGGDKKTREQWKYGPGNPHPAQVVIVDESSMLDLHLLYRLLTGTSETCRLVFVGDPYQLPSVGAGDVLRDLATCGRFSHTHLSEIFRQSDTSNIVMAAHSIHAGETPDMEQQDFRLEVVSDTDNDYEASIVIRRLAVRLYNEGSNFQVLSPRHKGAAGVTSLNELLRAVINPPGPDRPERNIARSTVRLGDRVMVIKNDYDNNVYNGDVGKVSRIDHKKKELEIRVFGPSDQPEQRVVYKVDKGAPPIRLAYAQTIHKSQGQEYDVIVVPMLKSHGWQLQRNLLYTAITRAKKKVVIVGHHEAVAKAVRNDQSDQRNTNLAARLRLGGEIASEVG